MNFSFPTLKKKYTFNFNLLIQHDPKSEEYKQLVFKKASSKQFTQTLKYLLVYIPKLSKTL